MARLTRAHIVTRIAAGIVGSWLFALGFVSVGILLLARLGMTYGNAQTLMFLLGVLALLSGFVWSFAAASAGRVWAVLGGGGVVMTGAAWWLAQRLN